MSYSGITIYKRKSLILIIFTYLLLILISITFIAPVYWVFVSSVKPKEIQYSHLSLIPQKITFSNYVQLFKKTDFLIWFINSLIVSIIGTLLGLFFCTLGGFGFAKYKFRFRNVLFLILIASMMLPVQVTMIPLFIIFYRLRIINSYISLILPHAINAFGIFLMRQYLKSVPDDILDAARIDGCSEFKIYWKIILPIIRPAIGALGILLFLESWNDYVYPLIFISNSKLFTLQIGIAGFFAKTWNQGLGLITSATIISILPILVVFLLLQKEFISGLTLGSVKE